LPSEGKTMLAVALARSIASGGRKVLLVDCDLRRPQVAQILGDTLEDGVISVLRDGDESERMIGIDPYSGLHYIVAGRNNEDPQELLNSRNMQRFLEAVRPKYDVVLLDSPPVLAVSDALILSRLADLTVFLVRWDHTPRTAVVSALRQLRTAGARLSGVVLSRIDMRRKSDYGYVGGGMWEKECRHYYAE
jgi:capsular exopolysaccharide synthesis family protein